VKELVLAPQCKFQKCNLASLWLPLHWSLKLINHLRVLRELAEVLTKPLSIICQQSWLTGEVPVDWRLTNVTPIYKKGWEEDPGIYRPVRLISVLGKVME